MDIKREKIVLAFVGSGKILLGLRIGGESKRLKTGAPGWGAVKRGLLLLHIYVFTDYISV